MISSPKMVSFNDKLYRRGVDVLGAREAGTIVVERERPDPARLVRLAGDDPHLHRAVSRPQIDGAGDRRLQLPRRQEAKPSSDPRIDSGRLTWGRNRINLRRTVDTMRAKTT